MSKKVLDCIKERKLFLQSTSHKKSPHVRPKFDIKGHKRTLIFFLITIFLEYFSCLKSDLFKTFPKL